MRNGKINAGGVAASAFVAAMFALVMAIAMPTAAWADDMSGSCGATDNDNVTWSLTQNTDGSTYTLTISGDGAMADYPNWNNQGQEDTRPWASYMPKVSKIEVGEGVTHIGDRALHFKERIDQGNRENCPELTISLPESLTSIGNEAMTFANVKTIDIPSKVETMGDSVFYECKNLTEVTGASSLKKVGNYCFWMSSLSKMDMSSLEEMGSRSFAKTPLESVSVPSAKTVGEYAFGECTSLKSITFSPNAVLADQVIWGDTSLEVVDFAGAQVKLGKPIDSSKQPLKFGDGKYPNLKEVLGLGGATDDSVWSRMFTGCANLERVDFSGAKATLGDWMFSSCTNLKSVDGIQNVESLGIGVFNNCQNLSYLKIPAKLKTVASDGASWFVTSSTGVQVLDFTTVEDLSSVAFNVTGNLSPKSGACIYVANASDADTIAAYASPNKIPVLVVNGGSIDGSKTGFDAVSNSGYKVEWYTDSTCQNRVSDTVISPESGKTYYAKWVENIVASGDCSAAGDGSVTWKLIQTNEDATNPTYTLKISGTGAMADYATGGSVPWKDYKAGISSVVVFDGVTSLGDRSFMGCSNLTSVDMADSVASYGTNCFNGCTGLAALNIGKNVTTIKQIGISTCASLVDLTVDAENPKYSAINGWLYEFPGDGTACLLQVPGGVAASIAFIDVPDQVSFGGVDCKVVSVGKMNDVDGGYVFSGAKNATSVTLGANVTTVGANAFNGCAKLPSIDMSNVSEIGYAAFTGCSGLKNVQLGDSLSTISNNAFQYCSGLTSVRIPDSVGTIGKAAFGSNTALSVVRLGAGLTSLGNSAFDRDADLVALDMTKVAADAFLPSDNVMINRSNAKLAIVYTASSAVLDAWKNAKLGTLATTALADVEGGTFAEGATFEEGVLATPTKDGYIFGGWYDNANFSGDTVTSAKGDCSYYAKWNSEITFNANGGDGTMNAQVVADGEVVDLTENEFTREGYKFAGWNTAADGTGDAYTDKQQVTPSGSMTLYAQWTPVYVVSIDGSEFTYTGKEINPAVTVKYGSDVLAAGDYDVAYFNNIDANDNGYAVVVPHADKSKSIISPSFKIMKDENPTVEITLPSNLTYDGSEKTVTAIAKTSAGNEISGENITVEYYDNEKCEGSATLVAPNAAIDFWAKVTLKGTDNYAEKTEVVKVSIAKATPTVDFGIAGNSVSKTYGDDRFTQAATAKDAGDGQTFDIKYASDNPDVATVDESTGEVSIVSAGTAKITATATARSDDNYEVGHAEYTLTVATKLIDKPVASATKLTYNGSEQTYLASPSDGWYTVDGGSATNARSYKATVKLADKSNTAWNNGDEASSTDDLTYDYAIDKATPSVTLAGKEATYTGSAIAADEAKVTFNGKDVSADASSVTYEYFTDEACSADKKLGGAPTSVGAYYVKATANFAADANFATTTSDAVKLVVKAADIKGVAASGWSGAYDGAPHGIAVTAPEGATVKYGETADACTANKSPEYTDASEHEVFYEVTMPGHNVVKGSAKVVIAKASLDMSKVSFAGDKKEYNGEVQKLAVSGDLPQGVTVGYANNDNKNVGTYEVQAIFALSDELAKNYNVPASMKATLTITPAVIDAPAATTTAFVYNGQAQKYFDKLDISSIAGEYAYSVADNVRTNAGTQTVTLSLVDKDNTVWKSTSKSDDLEYNFAIAKQQIDVSGVKFSGDDSVVYDKAPHNLEAIGVPAGINVVYSYSKDGNAIPADKVINAGNYTVVAEFSLVDAGNTEIKGNTAGVATMLTIHKKQIDAPAADTTVFDYNGKAQTYAIAASEWYKVEGNVQTEAGTYNVTVSLNDANNTVWSDGTSDAKVYAFTIRATSDTTPASGEASQQGTLNNPVETTFGETVNFTVNIAKRANSGVATFALTQEETETVPAGKVGFYYNGTRLGNFVDYDAAAGTATLAYDTNSKVIPAGSLQQLKVKFGGTDELAPSETDFFVKVDKANQTLAFAKAEVSQHVGTLTNALSGAIGAVTFASSDAKVATVATDGIVTIVAPGAATITATAAGDEWYNEATATYALTATEHVFDETHYAYDAKNPTKGHWQYCTIDGCTATTSITDHIFGEWKVNVPATATTAGEREHGCTKCGYEESQEIPAATAPVFKAAALSVHISSSAVDSPELENVAKGDAVTYSISDEKVATIDAAGKVTSVAAGKATVTATVTSADGTHKPLTATYEVTVTDHEFVEDEVTTPATCTEPGVETFKCKFDGCNETKTEVLSALGHAWADSFTVDTPATCTTDGSQSKHCTRVDGNNKLCDAINPDSVEAIPATGHQLVYQSNADGHWQQCTKCDYVTESEAHQFGEWTVTKEATATEAGEKAHTCLVCGYTATEEIAATGDNKGDQGDTGNKGDSGDQGNKGDQGGNSGTTGTDTGKSDNGNGATGDKPNAGSNQGNAAGNGSNAANNGNAMAATADGMAGVAGAAAAMGAIALAGAAFAARRHHNG